MKFTYDIKQDDRECVAYLHSCGALFFSAKSTYSEHGLKQGTISLGGRYNCTSKACPNGTATLCEVIRNDGNSGTKFYPGDSVTITFEETKQ
ncbi:hypothetical protein [Phaeobacter italicus]|jgi:hypothetical protein|uniref:hypothetical protein n=1 Tax=Phaeobacter italicus TaxID=481446 RepID=UPI002FDD1837